MKIDAPDPLISMLVHALSIVGDDPARVGQVTKFFKEAGTAIREAHRVSLLSDEEYWGDSIHQHLENVEKASAQAQPQAQPPIQEE